MQLTHFNTMTMTEDQLYEAMIYAGIDLLSQCIESGLAVTFTQSVI